MFKARLFHLIEHALNFYHGFRSGYGSRHKIQLKLDVFYPASNNFWLDSNSTFEDANQFPTQLGLLSRSTTSFASSDEMFTSFSDSEERKSSITLDSVISAFERFGSDKASTGLASVYHFLLARLPKNSNIIEIGIGTNNPRLVSTMGKSGIPGASLCAYEYLVPDANIFGVDVDRDILFATARIRTSYADQKNLSTLKSLPLQFGVKNFDLLIDDGLHSPQANLNSLIFGLDFVAPGGFIWIEDIPARSLPVWNVVEQIIQNKCDLFRVIKVNENGFGVLIRTRSGDNSIEI